MKQLNISNQLYETTEKYGNREAIYFEGIRLTYKELNEQVSMLSKGLLVNGVNRGDHIGVSLQNSIQLIVIYYAIARIGAVFVPINPGFKENETNHIINQSDVTVLFCDAARHFQKTCSKIKNFKFKISVGFTDPDFVSYEDLLMAVEKDEYIHEQPKEDLATIMYTSGTTGKPKGAMLTHRNLLSATIAAGRRMQVTEEDVYIIPSPLFHIFGVTFILRALTSGGKLVLMRKYSVTNTLKLIEQEKVTVHPGVPTMFNLELNFPQIDKYDLRSLRTGEVAAAPSSIELIKKIREKMNCNILIAYGMTETSATVTITSFEDSDGVRSETVGKTIPGTEVKIVDECRNECDIGEVGEIACRGPGITKGYYKKPKETAEVIDEEGWFYTGDLATKDKSGYIRIVGRKSDTIISGGYNVYPKELEDTLHEYTGIADAAVVGTPDPLLGEVVVACIVKQQGAEILLPELEEYMKNNFVKYKLPKYYMFMEALPVMPSGKISKLKLKEIVEENLLTSETIT